ncbi:MAG TPA: GntG family PLP-dependent aldolase [Candidatus Eisenbacteria bacterium]|nr:GntG family PLP-dependent aldolase [Candidatus Eisenbacteria bacterium]
MPNPAPRHAGAVDMRSDTVTRPTPAMKQAMMAAELGDDVFGDDPTVKALERRIAALTAKEAALYVPSGTMGNELAVAVHTRPGDEVLLEVRSHIFSAEQGSLAANSGCLAHVVHAERGRIGPEAIEQALRTEDDHHACLALLCLENTHNMHGGTIVPLELVRATAAAAHAHDMAVHLDGARLWNASVATGLSIAELAAPADTVMMCFSKGLGAPVGSILAGPERLMRAARRVRKRWGGGMRQAGVLAGACLYALDHHVARLADDHARARRLAAGLAAPGVRVAAPETNIVFVAFEDPALDPARVLDGLELRGVRWSQYDTRLRAVLHLDVDDAGVERAIAAFHDSLDQARAARRPTAGAAAAMDRPIGA